MGGGGGGMMVKFELKGMGADLLLRQGRHGCRVVDCKRRVRVQVGNALVVLAQLAAQHDVFPFTAAAAGCTVLVVHAKRVAETERITEGWQAHGAHFRL